MKFPFLQIIALSIFAISCSDQNKDKISSDSSPKPDSLKSELRSNWRELTESWTESLNLKNASIMKSFYSDSVIYYGDKISSDDVVKRQQSYFSSNPDYHQKILEYIDEEQQPDGTWRVRITKQVTTAGKTADYPSSLIYGNNNGIWKIISESDAITDLKKGQRISAHYGPEIITLTGWLEENTGFGKSKEGDPKSDKKILYYVVWPSQPLDVISADDQKQNENIPEKNVDRIQLEGDVLSITPFLNKKVTITGTLAHSKNDSHFTKVILHVKEIHEFK